MMRTFYSNNWPVLIFDKLSAISEARSIMKCTQINSVCSGIYPPITYQTTSLSLVGDKIEIIGRQQIKLSCLATRIPRIARGRMTSHRQVSTSFQTEGHP
jgi:hypothetical protein